MHFVWAGNREEINQNLVFSWSGEENPDMLTLCAADFFQIYIDGKFVAYGPERSPKGYTREYRLILTKACKIEILVSGYNVPTYCCDLQLPFFAVKLFKNGETIAETEDFLCYKNNKRRQDVPRYSFQRGFVEVYDYRNNGNTKLEQYAVSAPKILKGVGDTANYETIDCSLKSISPFVMFDDRHIPWWYKKDNYKTPTSYFNIDRDFLQAVTLGFVAFDYELESIKTGFIKLEVDAEEELNIFATFEEVLIDGAWIFGRSNDNDLVHWIFPKGKYTVWTAEPYMFKHLKLLVKGKGKVVPSLVMYENCKKSLVEVSGDEKICNLMQAAENTFRQNAVDIFTDCPGRERAGWLCDSYFTAMSERLFFGESIIERQFLENIILAKTDDIVEGMLPKCFPSEQQSKDDYIPNWAMWFVLELYEYEIHTNDTSLSILAREKVYKLLRFFEKYENEYGLLEDLSGSVFVEWSVSNHQDYISGVNFPTNMLYAKTLESVAGLYEDKDLICKAQRLRERIKQFSYNGEFFVDNAIRVKGELISQNEHISETCQYYALYFGIEVDEKFKKKIMRDFGPSRKSDVYPKIGKSNMFIGNYLRLFWLGEEKQYDKIFEESFEYFSKMAETTGTLWEHNNIGTGVSCNHGFASVVAVLIARSALGYIGTIKGKPIFDKKFNKDKSLEVKIVLLNKN